MANVPFTPNPQQPATPSRVGEGAPSGPRRHLPLVGAVLASVALGFSVASWVFRGSANQSTPPSVAPTAGPSAAVAKDEETKWRPGDPVVIGADHIVARPAGSDVPYVVIVKVAVVGLQNDSSWESTVNSRLERLRDAVTTQLMETHFTKMQAVGYKASLAAQLKVRFSKIPGLETIQEVLIPMFAVQ